MDEEFDNRILCKYGEGCYQKNPDHHQKYKHPVKRNSEDEEHHSPPKKLNKGGENSKGNLNNFTNNMIIVNELPTDIKEKIKFLFLVEMPTDFFSFYEFCKSLSSADPKNALKPLNIELVGPFDVFEGPVQNCTKDEALSYCRYYFDPPEFQTVLKVDDKELLHFGYFRDDPKELPCFIAKNKAAISSAFFCVAGNLFGAVNVHAEEVKGSADIFRKMKIQKIQSALIKWAKKFNLTLDTVTPQIKERRSRVVAKTFNGLGLVVPYDKKTDIGYRSLDLSEDELKKLLKKITSASSDEERDVAWSKLQPVITAASIANDECDFGTSLELGLNMFFSGEEIFHIIVEQILCVTYSLLKRNQFAEILRAHLKHRKKGSTFNTFLGAA